MKPLVKTLTRWRLTPSDKLPSEHMIPEIAVEPPVTALQALLEQELIPDPVLDRNEQEVAWVGKTTWCWTTTFHVSKNWLNRDLVELCLDGVDTVATVTINGRHVADLANMHQRHRIPVGPHLRPGKNHIQIQTKPPVAWARAQMEQHGTLPWIPWTEEPMPWNFIRKMACNFGWDWGPTLVDSGLVGQVRLEARSGGRVAAVAPETTINDKDAELGLQITVSPMSDSQLVLTAELFSPDDSEVLVASLSSPVDQSLTNRGNVRAHLTLGIPNPRIWWPIGHGEQPRYTLRVTLHVRHEDGNEAASEDNLSTVDTWTGRIGLRTVELDTTPDPPGHRFAIRVNGRDIFCKGANWIPDDVLVARTTPQQYRARIQSAVDAHHNMLRVWGGGIYETDEFYDICDELGVLVWQDFLFACAMYPEEPPFPELIAAEARDQTRRLAHRPSLVLWNGNNENFWGYLSWGHPRWEKQVGDRGWGSRYYLDVLPDVVASESPAIPWFPGSPYSGQPDDEVPSLIHPLHDDAGTRHVWDAWNETSADAYLDYRPRFAAEFGFQGPMCWATLQEACPNTDLDSLTPESEAILFRQRAINGAAKLQQRLEERYDATDLDLHRWHHLTQLNQAESVVRGITWYRSLWPHCTGTLYWQLNDCWPAISWAAIDSAGRRKPLWYLLRRAYSPRCTAIVPALTPPDGSRAHQASPRPEWSSLNTLDAVFFNDTAEPWTVQPVATLMNTAGEVLKSVALGRHTAASRSVLRVALPDSLPHAQLHERNEDLLLVVRCGSEPSHSLPSRGSVQRAIHFHRPDKDLTLPQAKWHAELERDKHRWRIRIVARTLVRGLILHVDKLDPAAQLSDQPFTLLPGDEVELLLESEREWNAIELMQAPVALAVNG